MFDLWSALRRVLLEWQLQSCLQNCNTGQCQSGYFDEIFFLSCVVLAQKICILNCLLKLDAHCPSQMFDLDCSVSLTGVAIVVELLAEPQHCTMLPQGGCFDEISFFLIEDLREKFEAGLD